MQCPHCRAHFASGPITESDYGVDQAMHWGQRSYRCIACERLIVVFIAYAVDPMTSRPLIQPVQLSEMVVYPRATSRPPIPLEVPAELAKPYTEACLILNDSPMASAALARRCLQHMLRDKAGVRERTLAKEIEKVLASNTLPVPLADTIDAIRNFGNFGAHPIEDAETGAIVEVEPEEAEWTLEIVERLFDFYYVQAARSQARIAALNEKLQRAGQPPAK